MSEFEAPPAFESHQPRLTALAYRMLGSVAEAEDAVQEAWLRLSRTDGVENLGAWLTTVTARICLNVLRAREAHGEEPLSVDVPDPLVGPEHEALLADAVGLALQVVLGTLTPAERLAFVLHDLFSVPFEEVAGLLDRSPEATRQLASRARRRLKGEAPVPDGDLGTQRAVVDAFFAAAREGDLDGLVAVLHPDVVLRADGGPGRSTSLRGATSVASEATMFQALADLVQPVLVNGAAGAVVVHHGKMLSVMAFTVTGGRIAAIDVVHDLERLARLTPAG